MYESSNQPERTKVANQIKDIRDTEKAGMVTANRNARAYINTFLGLRELFDHVRHLDTNVVLDVGAGTTQGISEISRSTLGEKLDFRATVLYRTPDIAKNLGNEKTTSTSAEVLRGIQDTSVGAILGLNSFARSDAPSLVANRFNEVLVPGGVIKATFLARNIKGLYILGVNTSEELSKALQSLNYDIAIISQDTYEILLAIKPGKTNAPSAQYLLEIDKKSMIEQESSLPK